MIARILAAAVCLASLAAGAQRPDCPRQDAPPPTAPPGPVPTFMPPFTPPARFGDPMPAMPSRELTAADLGPAEMQRTQDEVERRRAANWLMDVEEGHVSSFIWLEKRARAERLPSDYAGGLAEVARTPLASWRYVGYFDEHQKSRANRLFRSPDGSVLSLEEWHYKRDGGAIMTLPGMNNAKVRGRPAALHGMRAPSGCVSSSLSWHDERKQYTLDIAGPLDVEAQRALLVQVAEAIAAQ